MASISSLSYLRPEVAALKKTLDDFVENDCIPAEEEFTNHMKNRHGNDRWCLEAIPPCLERLKGKAKTLGLWNLFLPPHLISKVPNDPSLLLPKVPLSYREYGIMCESLGRCPNIAPEACNTSAPDTGNMEVLLEFGTAAQKEKYLLPLLRGDIRSTFLMTEPDVASSDPTNLQAKLTKHKNKNNSVMVPSSSGGGGGIEEEEDTVVTEYTLTGRKWWSTGAMDPRCRLALVVARMDYSQSNDDAGKNHHVNNHNNSSKHGAHTVVAVELPHPAVIMKRPLTVFGWDDAPFGHAEVILDRVRLQECDLILGEGSGFRVSQARLGPGRIHHCMRAIGMTARCYELMLQRALERKTFGKYLWEHGGVQEAIADSVADLESARLLTLSCADAMDVVGPKRARDKIGCIKVAVPHLAYNVVDRAVQLFGGAGLNDDVILARTLAGLRSLRVADGPDAVHKRSVALMEVKKAKRLLRDSRHCRL